ERYKKMQAKPEKTSTNSGCLEKDRKMALEHDVEELTKVPEDAVETVVETIKTKSTTFKIFEDGKKVRRTTELRKPEEVIE
ncbi:hypothetical protein Tco_1011403, partial [Tanacetum coccineum]